LPRRYFRNDCGRELEESERGARELEWLASFFDRSGKVSRDVISQDAFQTPSVLLFSPLGSERAESKELSANSSNRRQRARAKREREREHQIRKKLRERTSEREKKTCLLFVSLGLSTHTSKQKSKKAKKQTIAPYRWRLFRQQLLFPTKPGIMQRATAQTGARGAGGPVALRQQQQRRMPMLSRPSSSSSPSASPSFLLRSATEKAASLSPSTADGNESEGDIRSKANRRGRFLCLGGSGKSFETSKRLGGSLGAKPDVGPSSSSSSSSSL